MRSKASAESHALSLSYFTYIPVNSSYEIRVVVLSYRVLHVRKMAISSLRSFRDLLLSGDETSALKCFSDLDKCSIASTKRKSVSLLSQYLLSWPSRLAIDLGGDRFEQ